MSETETKKCKVGMYGETEKVNIGKFTISQTTDKEGETRIWIQDNQGGEGGEFDGKYFESAIEELFNKFF